MPQTLPDSRHGPHSIANDPRAHEFAERDVITDYQPSDPFKDLRLLWPIIWRSRWIIGIILGVAILLGLVIAFTRPVYYDAMSSVQIDFQVTRALGRSSDVEPAIDQQDADRTLRTQVDIVGSRDMAIRVAEKERLFGDPAFLKAMGSKPKDDAKPNPAKDRETVIEMLRTNLGIDLPRDSRLLVIRFRSPDPVMAARIANAFAQSALDADLQRRVERIANARDLLSSQLANAKLRLETSERQLNAYARSANLIDTSAPGSSEGVGPRSVTTATLVGLNDALTASTAKRIETEQRWRLAEATPAQNLGEALDNQGIQRLIEMRSSKQAQVDGETRLHRDGYPTVVQSKTELATINRQLNTMADAIRRSLKDQYTAAARQEQELKARVDQTKVATLSEQDRGVQFGILKREVETNRTLYDGLLQRFKELSASMNAMTSNMTVVDVADPPLRPSSSRRIFLIGAVALGIALAAAIVFLRERMDESLRSPKQLEKELGLPLLGVIPALEAKADFMEQVQIPGSPAAEAYSALIVPLQLATPHGLPRSLCITSTDKGEGKSSSAFALAHGLAKRGKRVLIVDADLRRPALDGYFEKSNTIGLSNLLVNEVSFEQAIEPTHFEGLSLMKSGPRPPNPAELLASTALEQMLDRAKDSYDIVVVDAPPVLGLADAATLAGIAEVTVIIIESGRTRMGAVRNALARLIHAGARVVGGVVVKFDANQSGRGYEYGIQQYTLD